MSISYFSSANANPNYFERINQRRNKPETQQEYIEAIEKEYSKFELSKNPQDLKRVINDEWKKSWRDNYPLLGDAVSMVLRYVVPTLIVAALGSSASTNKAEAEKYKKKAEWMEHERNLVCGYRSDLERKVQQLETQVQMYQEGQPHDDIPQCPIEIG